MHLYITANDINIEMPDVTLLDGCMPCISAVTRDAGVSKKGGREVEDCNFEPAIWFKVIVIDDLSIDCSNKVISWNCDNEDADIAYIRSTRVVSNKNKDSGIDSCCFTDESPLIGGTTDQLGSGIGIGGPTYKHKLARSAYGSGDDLSGYDGDLDEVFDVLPDIVTRYKLQKLSTVEFHVEVKRLLHVFILPSVRLTAENIKSVHKCITLQDDHLKTINRQIISQTEKIEKLRQKRREVRLRFVHLLESSSAIESRPAWSKTFVQALYDDLQEDISEATELTDSLRSIKDEKIIYMRDTEDMIKSISATGDQMQVDHEGHRTAPQLKGIRDILGEMLRSFEKHNLFRFRRRHDNTSGDDPLHRMYLEVKEMERKELEEIITLTNRKVLITSVKEAARAALEELMKGEDTCGVDASSTEARSATDVLSTGTVSRGWQTLTQQVAVIFSDRSHSLCRKHFRFCQEVVSRCQAAIDEKQLLDCRLSVRSVQSNGSNCRSSATPSIQYSTRSTDSIDAESIYSQHLSVSTSARESTVSTVSSIGGHVEPDPFLLSTSSAESRTSSKSQESVRLNSKKLFRWGSKKEDKPKKSKKNMPVQASFQSYLLDVNASSFILQPPECATINQILSSSLPTSIASAGTFSNTSIPTEHAVTNLVSEAVEQSYDADGIISVNTPDIENIRNPSIVTSHCSGSLSDIPVIKFGESFDNAVVIFEKGKDYIRNAIEHLRRDIAAHFESICRAVQTELKMPRHFNKIWLAYEPHFYAETMDSLIQLYAAEYQSVTQSLSEAIESLTISDLSLDNAILTHMLQDATAPAVNDDVTPKATGSPAAAHREAFLYSTLYRRNQENKRPVPYANPQTIHYELNDSASDVNTLLNHVDDCFVDLKLNTNVQQLESTDSTVTHKQRTAVELEPESTSAENKDMDCASKDTDSSVALLRRHLSNPSQSRLDTVRLSLVVQGPTKSVIVYERTLCPVRQSVFSDSSDPCSPLSPSDDANNSFESNNEVLCQVKTLRLKQKYRKQFAGALSCIMDAIKSKSPASKLQHLNRCLREVSQQISQFYEELYNDRSMGACSDELMDALVILLCNSATDLPRLYSQIMILADTIPPFLTCGPLSFTLVQFVGACQFIQERLVMKRTRQLQAETSAAQINTTSDA